MEKPSPVRIGDLNFTLQEYGSDLHPAALNSRIYSAMLKRESSYPICRRLSFAVYSDLEKFFDDLALNLGWNVHRRNVGEMLMDADGLFIKADGFRKSDYCSCVFKIWADGIAQAESAQAAILALAEATKINSPMVTICWSFLSAKDELQKTYVEELVADILCDEAYPELEEGVVKFINNYLDSPESILVLQGNPGTGKTRLIRSILGTMAMRKKEKVSALYTSDKKTMENDEIFVNFVTGDEEAFVIEDADYILKPRTEGNDNLHRFLTIADGVVRSQGRKIIFSTNLPNVGDIDDALIRPGRCFSRLMVRELNRMEAQKLLARLCDGNEQKAKVIAEQLPDADRRTYSVAEIYRQYDLACRQESGEEVIKRVSRNVGHSIGF